MFGHKAIFWFRLWSQGLVKILSWNSGEILKLKFGQYFAADAWLRSRSWFLVKILKLGPVKIFSFSLVEILMLKLMLNRDFEIETLKILRACDMNSTLGSVVPLAMFFGIQLGSLFSSPGWLQSASCNLGYWIRYPRYWLGRVSYSILTMQKE